MENLTKEQIKKQVIDFIAEVTLTKKTVPVTNEFLHKAAVQLVEAGYATIVYKKNYGKIGAIRSTDKS